MAYSCQRGSDEEGGRGRKEEEGRRRSQERATNRSLLPLVHIISLWFTLSPSSSSVTLSHSGSSQRLSNWTLASCSSYSLLLHLLSSSWSTCVHLEEYSTTKPR